MMVVAVVVTRRSRTVPARAGLGALATDATRELDVLRHDRHPLGVDRAQVRVLEEADQVRLARLLQRHHRRALETQVGLEVLRDLADETLERQLADEELGALLVATDLAEGDCAGTIAMRLLDAPGRGRRLAGGLRGELLAGRLPTGTLASGLLRTSHFDDDDDEIRMIRWMDGERCVRDGGRIENDAVRRGTAVYMAVDDDR